VEYGAGMKKEDLAQLEKEIVADMHQKLKVRPQIEWLPPNTLDRAAMKTKFIEKAYEQKKK
ncbi:MAG: phenylacetate--CoA ligase family protein, partial [Proteobacteria bacterium]|nr:phenylacetate--CoA ligase family protein [Pseudomonadota bacterium]